MPTMSHIKMDADRYIRSGSPYDTFHNNGRLHCREYHIDNILHRIDGPALSMWDSNGVLVLEEWYNKGIITRPENKPSISTWYGNSALESKEWYLDGEKHRTNGPALIFWREGGEFDFCEWWVNGEDITESVNIWRKKNRLGVNFNNWPDENKLMFKLYWC